MEQRNLLNPAEQLRANPQWAKPSVPVEVQVDQLRKQKEAKLFSITDRSDIKAICSLWHKQLDHLQRA
ncbi:MAG TPA: hypothetical protein VD794_07430 [Flavisolibacter sp.]|nr:hypothetical protein [Flavisolibacter sp.]